MRYSVWDKEIRSNFDRRQLTRQQRSFLEGLLLCLEPGAYLSDHVSTANSTVVALTRAHQALAGHAAGGQPKLGLLNRCLTTAASTVAAGLPAHQALGGGQQATQAHALLASIPGLLTSATSKATAAAYAPRVQAYIAPTAAHIRSWVTSVWDGPVLPPDVLARARGEVAALIVLDGRDPRSLHVDLIRKGSRAVQDAVSITAVLWPPSRTYRVAGLVQGASQLEHLDQLLPGSRQSPLLASRPVTVGAQELTARAAAIKGPAVMIDLPVVAADAATAVVRARRQISEVLDQYAAGQRLVDLTLGPHTITVDDAGRRESHDLTSVSTSVARPLTTHWPVSLRPALRSAHLAARLDAPMASSVLAWSAIDSLDVESTQLDLVAKACALHSIRQLLIALYQTVTDSALNYLRSAQMRLANDTSDLAKLERAVGRTQTLEQLAARAAHAQLAEQARHARQQLAPQERAVRSLEQTVTSHAAVVRRVLLKDGDNGHPLRLTSWKLDVNGWLDVLLPARAQTGQDVRDAQAAIDALSRMAGGYAQDTLTLWHARLADPKLLSDWLQDQQDVLHALLEWLYATRNSAIHRGQFTAPADAMTAHAARGVVDMLLEFLGNWHKIQYSRGVAESDALSVIRDLANRKDSLTHHLAQAPSCHPLNLESVTGPGVDCWNRS
ncbi:hypothetical protein [Streptomyces sp. NPDC096142]|uniref:hypothetical protein n=1 Tax=Streptomyces sp. NPDC096142 TaxID=3366077 RepID=UPI003804D3A6